MTSEYRDGKQVTTVTKDGVTLSVTLSKEKNSYGKFYQSGVMLVNASGETFTFDPKDIVVKVIDKYDNVKDMGVYSSDEYARKVTRLDAVLLACVRCHGFRRPLYRLHRRRDTEGIAERQPEERD